MPLQAKPRPLGCWSWVRSPKWPSLSPPWGKRFILFTSPSWLLVVVLCSCLCFSWIFLMYGCMLGVVSIWNHDIFHIYKNSYVSLNALWLSTCTLFVENIYLMIYVVFLHDFFYLYVFMKDIYIYNFHAHYFVCYGMYENVGCQTWWKVAAFKSLT